MILILISVVSTVSVKKETSCGQLRIQLLHNPFSKRIWWLCSAVGAGFSSSYTRIFHMYWSAWGHSQIGTCLFCVISFILQINLSVFTWVVSVRTEDHSIIRCDTCERFWNGFLPTETKHQMMEWLLKELCSIAAVDFQRFKKKKKKSVPKVTHRRC